MKGRAEALLIDAKDNVAVALEALPVGKVVAVTIADSIEQIVLLSDIPKGHKFALVNIPTRAAVIKYGQPIGYATTTISRGEHVHTHNVASHVADGGTE